MRRWETAGASSRGARRRQRRRSRREPCPFQRLPTEQSSGTDRRTRAAWHHRPLVGHAGDPELARDDIPAGMRQGEEAIGKARFRRRPAISLSPLSDITEAGARASAAARSDCRALALSVLSSRVSILPNGSHRRRRNGSSMESPEGTRARRAATALGEAVRAGRRCGPPWASRGPVFA